MNEVYDRLNGEGLGTQYVKKFLLPEWWNDSLASTKSGFLHGLSLIARRSGLQVGPLMTAGAPLEPRDFGPTKFKKPANANDSAGIKWAQYIAASAGTVIALATREAFRLPGMTAQQLRQKMGSSRAKPVTLRSLLDLAWSHGIPVLYFGHLPQGYKRMDGMAACLENRPVIVTSKKSDYEATLAFIVAHELAHVCLGHVGDGLVVDEELKGADTDAEEKEANDFAVELLMGTREARYDLGTFIPSRLVTAAKRIGAANGVDAGVVILNFAFHAAKTGGHWGMVTKALKLLDPDADATQLIREKMLKEIDMKGLDEDQREYIEALADCANPVVPE